MTQEETIQAKRMERDYKALADICNLLLHAQICAKHFNCETEQCGEVRKYIIDSVEVVTIKMWEIYTTWIAPYHLFETNEVVSQKEEQHK